MVFKKVKDGGDDPNVILVGFLCVDHLFRLGVNVMYHEDMYLVVQQV
jgi:hypothetical protein